MFFLQEDSKYKNTASKCLIFYKCTNCDRIISVKEGSCCIICEYSDKVCKGFLEEVLREYAKE